jgi:formylglycine-generating enzyme required for sulfatase activity
MTDSRSLITPSIFHDQPLEPGRMGDEAFFRFEEYATTFARLIASPTTRTPLVVGLSGKWGSGKTTLLKLLRAKLDTTDQPWPPDLTKIPFLNSKTETAKDIRRCRTVWFNAWKYADEDSLLAALIRTILSEMARGDWKDKLTGAALNKFFPRRDVLATFLGMFKFKLGDAGFEPDVNATKTETPFARNAAFFDDFNEAFDQLLAAWVHGTLDAKRIEPEKGVLAVFIDDLDRCLPAKTVQVLEAIKLFLDKTGAVFVIGADDDIIGSAVEVHYQNQKINGLSAKDYLEKIFQLRFALPPLAVEQMGDYMTGIGLKEDLRSSLDLIFAATETNPRQIKTFVNYLEVSWAILQNSGQAEGVSREDFTRWLALTRVAPEFCDHLRERVTKEIRLKFINDAVQWATGLDTQAFAEREENAFLLRTFREYESNQRLRRVLKQLAFSEKVNADVLEGFIFWSAAAAPLVEGPVSKMPPITGELRATLEGVVVDARGRVSPTAEYWITIPAGKFVMGSKPDSKLAGDDEKPQHTVDIPYDYLIARTLVTNAQFREFAEARQLDWKPGVPDDHPAVEVSWHNAQDYCAWLTEKMRQSGGLKESEVVRLPTEAEWEKAARGEYGNEWPWGNEWDASKCNSAESKTGGTTPVGQYSPAGDSPYGVADMVGNMWEWCSSLYKPYPYRSDDGREDVKADGERAVRGGSWVNNRRYARCAYRYRLVPDSFDYGFGFRVLSPGSISGF